MRDRKLGPDEPVFIVAEAGSNHNCDFDLAIRLIDAAAEAGADAVKFQTFKARRLYPRSAGTSDYLQLETPIYDLIEAMEMPPHWLPKLQRHAHNVGLAFISSPFDLEAVDLLLPYVDAFKIASYELTHAPLLRAVAAHDKPIFLSTGASSLDEVREAVATLKDGGCSDPILLQCTAAYPTPLAAANVRALVTLREEFGLMTGLSDHTRDPIAAPMAAAALGAVVLEKHFTLDNDMPGPDHAFAVEPDELARLVRAVRDLEAVLGTGAKQVHPVEEELRAFGRRSLFTTRPVRAGERFSAANVDILRHGKLAAGLAPGEQDRVLRSVASRDIPAETALTNADLEPVANAPAIGERSTQSIFGALSTRPAVAADCDTVFLWANDAETRRGSFHDRRISPEVHQAWFADALQGQARTLRMLEVDGRPAGLVRFDRAPTVSGDSASQLDPPPLPDLFCAPNAAGAPDPAGAPNPTGHPEPLRPFEANVVEIGITVAPEYRGRALAAPALVLACQDATVLGFTKIVARIKFENQKSIRAFERAGFVRVGTEQVRGSDAFRYEIRL